MHGDRHTKQSPKKGRKNPLVETAVNPRLLAALFKSKKCFIPITSLKFKSTAKFHFSTTLPKGQDFFGVLATR